jgi:hypothetical protein
VGLTGRPLLDAAGAVTTIVVGGTFLLSRRSLAVHAVPLVAAVWWPTLTQDQSNTPTRVWAFRCYRSMALVVALIKESPMRLSLWMKNFGSQNSSPLHLEERRIYAARLEGWPRARLGRATILRDARASARSSG